MVSFKPQGRLGNYLFQLATTIVYAAKYGIEFSAPALTNDRFWNPIYFPHLVNPKFEQGRADIIVEEKVLFKYDELPFKEEWRDKQIILRGYFQNPKYFMDGNLHDVYREALLNILNFPIREVPMKNTVSVHVRRGDYLQLTEKHPFISKGWIESAMRLFPNHTFLFFSDDIQWCQNEFGGREDCIFSVRRNEEEDLILMSQCNHHINSASTFSWWGAWLNRDLNKKVIVPKQWMTPSHSNQWTEEIVPKEWERR